MASRRWLHTKLILSLKYYQLRMTEGPTWSPHNSLPAPTISHQHFFFIGGLQPYFSWCIPPPTVPEYVTTAFMYFPMVFLLEKTPHSSCSLQFTSQPHSLLHVSLTLHQYMFHMFFLFFHIHTHPFHFSPLKIKFYLVLYVLFSFL